MTEAYPVKLFEGRRDAGDVRDVGQPYPDRVLLAVIAHVGLVAERHAGDIEVTAHGKARFVFQVCEHRAHAGKRSVVDRADQRLRDIGARIGEQHAERGKIAGVGRDDHPRDVQHPRQFGRGQRAAATEGKQAILARVTAALDRNLLDRARCDDGAEIEDALRDAVDTSFARKAERLCKLCPDDGARALDIELQLALEEAVRADPAEHGVGVGDGRFRAAAAKRDRAGFGACAARAELQAQASVEPCDRAAAGPDLDDVEHRRADRKAPFVTADVIGGLHVELAVFHQRAFGGGAADIERDHLPDAELPGVGAGADAAADRAGFHQRNRLRDGLRERHHAAVGTHHVEGAAEAALPDPLVETGNVALHPCADIGVRGYGGGPLVLRPFAAQFGRGGHKQIGQGGNQPLLRLLLMQRVQISVEKRHRDGFRPGLADGVDQAIQVLHIERFDDGAFRVDPFPDLEAERSRHQRCVAAIAEVERNGAIAAGDLENVAKALRRHQCGDRTGALDERIDDVGGAVLQQRGFVERRLGVLQPADHAGDEIAVGRERLAECRVSRTRIVARRRR